MVRYTKIKYELVVTDKKILYTEKYRHEPQCYILQRCEADRCTRHRSRDSVKTLKNIIKGSQLQT